MSLITHNRQGSFLLKVLLLVFALHTSIGYAACCIALEPADAETSMPCHDKKHDNQHDNKQGNNQDGNQNTHIDHNECCSSCFAIGIPASLTKSLSSNAEDITADTLILFISSSIDPLFRPPITLLS
jgi:hypothetical protein